MLKKVDRNQRKVLKIKKCYGILKLDMYKYLTLFFSKIKI